MNRLLWASKIIGLIALLFAFDVSFDSFLVTGHIDQRYIFRDGWSHTPAVAIVVYLGVLGSIAIGSLMVFRTRRATTQFISGAALAFGIVTLLRYGVHTFATIT